MCDVLKYTDLVVPKLNKYAKQAVAKMQNIKKLTVVGGYKII